MPPSDKEVKTAALLATKGISSNLASVYRQGNSIEVRTTMAALREVIEGDLKEAKISGVTVVVVAKK